MNGPNLYSPDGEFLFFGSQDTDGLNLLSPPEILEETDRRARYGTESDDAVDVTDEYVADECEEMFLDREIERMDSEQETADAWFQHVTPPAGLLIFESDESMVDDDRAAEIDAAARELFPEDFEEFEEGEVLTV
jgi:hypothetical protein